MPQLKLAIFDLDGTLVDSSLNFNEMRNEMGLPEGEPILEYLAGLSDQNERERLMQIVHRYEWEGALRATVYPGVGEFLKWLNSQGITTAILTRNSAKVCMHSLTLFPHFFSTILTRDDDFAPKPKPDGLWEIARRHNIEWHESIYIGDYLFDLEAAKAAGMTGVLFGQRVRHFDHMAPVKFSSYINLSDSFSDLLRPTGLTVSKR
jgi:HAD superfamily hydrolase (TIGR01509 family)